MMLKETMLSADDLKDLNRPKVVQPETMNRKQRRAQAAALRSHAQGESE